MHIEAVSLSSASVCDRSFFPRMCLGIDYFIETKKNDGTVYSDPIRAGQKIKITCVLHKKKISKI